MQLPVTLLYDYQSVAEIVEYIEGRIMAASDGGDDSVDEGEEGLAAESRPHQRDLPAEAPSNLLKTLRFALSLSVQGL